MKDTWSVMANPTHREIQQMLQKRDMTAGVSRVSLISSSVMSSHAPLVS